MSDSGNPRDEGMDNERISEELQALIQHMAQRGVSRKLGAYVCARLIGDIVGTWCESEDDAAMVLASLVKVARVQAGIAKAH